MSLGYACILTGIPEIRLKSCTLRYAAEEKLKHITLHNIWALNDMIDYNIRNGIRLFRISSDIIPFGSHPVNRLEWWKDYGSLLSDMGVKIRNSGMRVSMHPGQYTVLNSPDSSVVERSAADLIYHARFLDSLGMDISHKIILHTGGVYGNKAQSAGRFIENFRRLPEAIKSRLVLENDEKCYNIADVLTIAKEIQIPVVFDNLHHFLNNPGSPDSSSYTVTSHQSSSCTVTSPRSPTCTVTSPAPQIYIWIGRCRSTWKPEDGRQKIHYSQQLPGGKPGAHSQTIDTSEFAGFYSSLPDKDLDIMLEVKDKNLSVIKCMRSIQAL